MKTFLRIAWKVPVCSAIVLLSLTFTTLISMFASLTGFYRGGDANTAYWIELVVIGAVVVFTMRAVHEIAKPPVRFE